MAERQKESQNVRSDMSEKDQKLAKLVLATKDRYMHRRWLFEREWYRNSLFYNGQHWIVYDESFRRWRRRNMPAWVPMPVTNRLASTVNTIRAAVAQVQPAFDARPMQETERAVLSAHAAEKYLDVLQNESGFRAARRKMATWVTITGNAFFLVEYDNGSDTGTVNVPGERCVDCGAQIPPDQIPESLTCPKCGSKNLVEDPTSAMEIPQGRLITRTLSPFEVYVDPYIMELQDQPAVVVQEIRSIQAVKNTYGDKAKNVTADADKTIGRYYLDSLAYMTGSGFGGGASMGRSDGTIDSEEYGAVTLYKVFVKSSADYPDGVYVVMAGDQTILEVQNPYPYRHRTTNKPFYPVIHVRYDDVPGRFWGRTPVDDLVPKQRQRNEMESLYQTIIMRCANPIWMIPLGVQTSPITGDPSLILRYTGGQGQKPERLPGLDAPISVIKFIEQVDQDFEEIANTFAVMKGKSPGNVRAASAIQMLLERGYGRYGSVFDNLEEAYEQWALYALEIWRQRSVFPRVQAVSKVAGSWQFMEFLGADLSDVDLRVEAGSTRPKSQAGRQMLVQQMLQMGLMNPNDPEQRMKIFEELGATSLLPGAEADTKIVAEEDAKFMAWAQQVAAELEKPENQELPPDAVMTGVMQTFPMKVEPLLDHHPTHLVHHRRFAMTEEFRALPEIVKQLFVQQHLTQHYMFMIQELQTGIGPTGVVAAMMAQQQGPGQPGQSTPQGKQPARGKGPGGETNPQGSGTKVDANTMGNY